MLNRRNFLKLVGTASLTAIFGFSLSGCKEETKEEIEQANLTETNTFKYYSPRQHCFYIEISTETNGKANYHEYNITQENVDETSKSSSNGYYKAANSHIDNNFTKGLIYGTIIVNGTTLLYGNTDADNKEDIEIDSPEGYTNIKTEELKNEDNIYGYRIYMENTDSVMVRGYEDENGNMIFPFPGKVQTKTAKYNKVLSKGIRV